MIPSSTSSPLRDAVVLLREIDATRQMAVPSAVDIEAHPGFFGQTISKNYTYGDVIDIVSEVSDSGVLPGHVSNYVLGTLTKAALDAQDPAKINLRVFRYHNVASALSDAANNYAVRCVAKLLRAHAAVPAEEQANAIIDQMIATAKEEADNLKELWRTHDLECMTLMYPASGNIEIERAKHAYEIVLTPFARQLLVQALMAVPVNVSSP